MSSIPLSRPVRASTEQKYITEALDEGMLAGGGKFTKKCQQYIKTMCQAEKVLLTSNVTLALHVAALAVGIKPGDEVIIPTYTYVSTANAFTMHGAVPVFIDVDELSLNIDVAFLERAITSCTKAIVVVHYAGMPCDMDPIMHLARQHGLYVVDDAAQTLGSTYKSKPLGSIGDIACFSFHATKNVTSGGQGGALVVINSALLEAAQTAYWNGTNRAEFVAGKADEYSWIAPGLNCQMSEVLAALLWSQLELADDIRSRRMEICTMYRDLLWPIMNSGFIVFPASGNITGNGHIFYVLVTKHNQRQPLRQHLERLGITSAPHYSPLHSSLAGRTSGRYVTSHDVASRVANQLLRLPLFPDMTDDDVRKVADAVKHFFVPCHGKRLERL